MTTAEKLSKVYEGVEKTEALNAVLEKTLYGTDTGGKSFYDEFWDEVLGVGSWQYLFSGRGWTAKTFKPPFDLILSGNCNYCFYGNGASVDLVDRLSELGTQMNTSAITSANSMFASCRFTRLGVLDFTNCATLSAVFSYASQLQTIDELIIHENLKFSSAFSSCSNLEGINIKGTIGQNGLDFQSCKKLSRASIESIINCLSATTNGLSVTLSQTAVNNAFTTEEWDALITTKTNWTISLV